MRTVLIIGGSGTVGTHILAEIAQRGLSGQMRFICAARSEAAARKIRARGFEPIYIDLEKPDTLGAAVDGVTTVFLLKPYGIRMLNYAKSVVDAATSAGVQAIVNLSAFGPPCSCIDLLTWHRLVDSYVERSGLCYTHLRPSFFMEGLAARIDSNAGAVYSLSGSQNVPWVAGADIAASAVAIIRDIKRHAEKSYSLVSEIASAPHIAQLLGELSGKPFKAAAMDETKTIEALVARGREPVFAHAIVEYAKLAPTFDASHALGAIQAITGRAPASLREFLADYLRPAASTQPGAQRETC